MSEENNPEQLPENPQFAIQKVYLKDVSFETPNSPTIFKQEWKPLVDLHMTNEATPIEDDLYDIVLSITLTVKVGEAVACLAEVNQAGIFYISNLPDAVLNRMLATACPNILFPFAREAVANIVTRGGFPQLLLSPVNFDALYLQQQTAEQAEMQTTH